MGNRRMGAEPGRTELLAPAGNAAGFYGAVHAGADAVYLAGSRFGARAYAENFSQEELLECIRYGHLLGRRIYLAVNTLMKEGELQELYGYLAPLYEAGVDAVIVQDLGVLRFVRKHFPGLRIHASTQTTLCSGYGAALLKELGASRVIPARELSLKELAAMKERAGIEVEAFVHGAMCYCYSGQCLFSSILGGRSGNRGRCAQPCRLPYTVGMDGAWRKECYPLSLKDMCTIRHIPQLIEAGIDSFKIEGRMKKPEYAAGVTEIYRRHIDRYYELRESYGAQGAVERFRAEMEDGCSAQDLRNLSSLYVRCDLQNGYLFRRNGAEMVTIGSPAYSGGDDNMLEGIRERHLSARPKLPISVEAFFRIGQPARVTLRWEGVLAQTEGLPVERAKNQPVTEENVRKQLGRLGDSPFCVGEMKVAMDMDCFYPLRQINELRRIAVAALEEQILAVRSRDGNRPTRSVRTTAGDDFFPAVNEAAFPPAESMPNYGYAFSVRTLQQLEAVVRWVSERHDTANGLASRGEGRAGGPWRIYVDSELLLWDWQALQVLCRGLSGSRCSFYIALPHILREADGDYLGRILQRAQESGLFHGYLARSLDCLGYLRKHGAWESSMPCRLDAGVYVWNTYAAEEMAHVAAGFCLPYELNASEQRKLLAGLSGKGLAKRLPCEKIVYSRIPMMITANCLRRTLGKCGKLQPTGKDCVQASQSAVLKDRYGKEFPVLINCRNCTNIIYNSVPFSLQQELPKWRGRMDLRMDFALESPLQVRQLLDCFLEDAPLLQAEHTTGHEKRGVE